MRPDTLAELDQAFMENAVARRVAISNGGIYRPTDAAAKDLAAELASRIEDRHELEISARALVLTAGVLGGLVTAAREQRIHFSSELVLNLVGWAVGDLHDLAAGDTETRGASS